MVRQQRVEPPSSYPSPPGGNIGGLAKHLWDMWIPEPEFTEDDIISPTGTYETETSGDECNRVTKVYFVRRGFFNIKNTVKTLINTFVWRNPQCSIKPQIPPDNKEIETSVSRCDADTFWGIEKVGDYGEYNNGQYHFFPAGSPLINLLNYIKESKNQYAKEHLQIYNNDPEYRNNKLEIRWLDWFQPTTYAVKKYHKDTAISETIWVQGRERAANLWRVSERYDRGEWVPSQGNLGWYMSKFEIEYPPCLNSPPPPPPDECCKHMSCCPKNDNLEQLLRLILKRIGTPKQVTIFDEDLDRQGSQKAKKTPPSLNDFLKLAVERVEIANRIIGIENYPVEVPETVIDPYTEDGFGELFDFIPKNTTKKLRTLTEFLAWQVQQDSAVLGHFHQVIEYEAKEGEEKETIVLPNVAETLKELIILNTQSAKQVNVITDAIFRVLTELVQTKTQVCRNVAITEDIQDYLDYPTVTKNQEIDVSISIPGMVRHRDLGNGLGIIEGISGFGDEAEQEEEEENKENYAKFLEKGITRFVYEDWNGKNSLHDQLMDLLQMASMLRSIMYQRVDKD